MKSVFTLLLLAVSAQAFIISEFITNSDELTWQWNNDQLEGWQPSCGANETTDGCTLDMNYWTSHSSQLIHNKPNQMVDWPTDPMSSVFQFALDLLDLISAYDYHPFCFDAGRYAARHPSLNGNLTPPFLLHETLVHELRTFNGDITYLELLQQVNQGTLATPCALLSAEYVTALLNQCNRACQPVGFNETMTAIAALVYSPECFANPLLAGPPSGPWETYWTYLKNYNTGRVSYTNNGTCAPIVEPGYCYTGPGVKPANVTCVAEIPFCDLNYECTGGCTEPTGYWKTHRLSANNIGGGQKSVIGWDDICDDTFLNDTKGGSTAALEFFPFLQTGINWGAILNVSPQGDACVLAARQIIATQLNVNCKDHACLPAEIEGAMTEAIVLMGIHCLNDNPLCDILGLCPQDNHTDARRDILRHTNFLEDFNTGIHGPGPCEALGSVSAASSIEDNIAEVKETGEHSNAMILGVLITVCVSAFLLTVMSMMYIVKQLR